LILVLMCQKHMWFAVLFTIKRVNMKKLLKTIIYQFLVELTQAALIFHEGSLIII